MKRHLALIHFALGSAARRAARTVAIIVGLGLVAFSVAAVLFLTEALRREFHVAAQALPDLVMQRLVAGRPELIDLEDAETVRDIPGVVEVTPRIWGYYFIPALSGNLTVVGVDAGLERVQEDLALVVEEGRPPRGSGEVMLGRALAGFLGLEVEDEIMLPAGERERWLTVVGLFRSESALWTADVMMMPVDDARFFLAIPDGAATDIAVRVCASDEAVVVARKIAERLPEVRVIDRALMQRGYDLTFDTRAGILAAALLPAMVAFLIIAWDRLSSVGPAERREIGILKAVGWQTGDVILARCWENAIVGIAGALIGLLAAYVYVFPARAPGLSSVLLGWSVIYPPLDLTPAVDAAQLLSLLCLVVAPFVAVSVVPAWRAAVSDPYESLRGLA